jgi:hypothetical protein
MKKTIIRSCVFVVTFVAALIVSSMVLNRGNTDMTAEMEYPELPLIYVNVGDRHVNMMQGFLADMEVAYMRESIVPIGTDRGLSISVQRFGSEVSSLSFEVRSIDGTRLVEDTQIQEYTEEGDYLLADIVLKDLIDEETEYSLIFKLQLEDGREASYYTRIIQAEGYGVEEKLDFVAGFSADTFDKQRCANLGVYLEPNSEGDNSTLSHVTIHSSLDQVGWGDLAVQQVTEPVYLIQDITEQTAAITVEYLVSYTRYERERYAAVKETYRIRTGTERMYLLDYDRTMSEFFTEDASSFVDTEVVLGILDADVEMAESEGGKILAFEQAGVLYSLNVTENKLARLFSFYDLEGRNERSLYGGHDFKILQVDEAGNVFFAVYGYISRGRREGYCGVSVYFYNNSANTIEEMAFIPSSKSPEILKAELDQLSYLNGRNELYVFLNDKISCIHLEEHQVETIAENLNPDSCQVSESNRMVVWQNDGEKYRNSSLTLMNLSTGEQTLIEAEERDYLLPLGFMGEDIVYGVARSQDLTEDGAGATIFPMYQIRIQDENGEILMTYEKPGFYVTGCEMNENQIILSRVEKNGQGEYVACEDDQIVSGETAVSKTNQIITVPTQEDDRLTEIQLKTGIDTQKLKMQTPREVLYEGSREVVISPSDEYVDSYYVYDLDGDVTIVSTPAEAISLAYDIAGTVTSRDGFYVWRKERKNTRNQIMAIEGTAISEERGSLAVCLDVMLAYEGVMRNSEYLLEQGETVRQVLEENLENVQVLDLTGCSLESVLYYPDREIPVLAMLNDGNAVLIIGFNEMNVVLMNPESGTVYKMGMNDAQTWFEENGNEFLSYVKKEP